MKIDLIGAMNIMAAKELTPNKWVYYRCPNGHEKGKVRAEYFDMGRICSTCKQRIVARL